MTKTQAFDKAVKLLEKAERLTEGNTVAQADRYIEIAKVYAYLATDGRSTISDTMIGYK